MSVDYDFKNQDDIKRFLNDTHGCKDGQAWFMNEGIEGPIEVLRHMRKKNRFDMANWFMVHLMDKTQCNEFLMVASTYLDESYNVILGTETDLSKIRDKTIRITNEMTNLAKSRGKMQTKLINLGIKILFPDEKQIDV